MKQNKFITDFPILSLYNIKNWTFILLLTTSIFLSINCMIVANNLQKSIKHDFNEQLDVLSHESSQIIASNYSILEGIVHNMLTNRQKDMVVGFEEYTQKIGKYTPNVVLLADSNHAIIALTSQKNTYDKNLSVANRDYIKDVLNSPQEIHIGHLVHGVATKTWSIPIVKGIFVDNKHIGTVILSVPLTEFSKGLLKSHITLKNVQFGSTKHVSFYYPEIDRTTSIDPNTYRSISFKTILLTSFLGNKDITISKIYEPIANIAENITLVMQASHIQRLFWAQFGINFCIFVAVAISIMILLMAKKLSRKLGNIEEKLLDTIPKLQCLVPGYNNSSSFLEQTGFYSKMLSNVEHYVDSNVLVIDMLEKQHNDILEKNRQLITLQKHFAHCLNTLKEESLYFVEQIDDIYSNSRNDHTANNILYQDSKLLLSVFEKIYCYSKNHEEYIVSLHDSISKAQKIALSTKSKISIANILKSKFADKYDSLIINEHVNSKNIPTNSASLVRSDASQEPTNEFFTDAVEAVLDNILTMSTKDNCIIHLIKQNNSASIEIRFDLTKHAINNNQILEALERARLFALLDEGFIGVYNSEDILIISIVYNTSNMLLACPNKAINNLSVM